MTENLDTHDPHGPNPYSERYDLCFVVWGEALKTAHLVAVRGHANDCAIWEEGDVIGGRRRRTAGIRLDIGDFSTATETAGAVERFLAREATLLRAIRSEKARAALVCAMWVYPTTPVTMSLPCESLRRLAENGVEWEVVAYPCSKDHGP